MSNAKSLTPKFSIGERVHYIDHHDRSQTGAVRRIEGTWPSWGGDPYLVYTVEHPTYRNRTFYAGEGKITGVATS